MLKPIYVGLAFAAAWWAGALQAQTPAAASTDKNTAAVQLVAKTYAPNPLSKVTGLKMGLPKNGSWGARAATGAELVPACDAPGAVCLAVLYHAGQPEIVCGWTVLFAEGDPTGRVVSQNDATNTYMLRAFRAKDPDAPVLLSGLTPDSPPIARIAHQTGLVQARLSIDSSGAVQGTEIMDSTNPMFNNAVIDATRTWKLQPVVVGGQRVWAQVAVEVTFMDGSLTALSIKRAK
jgi:TonB family protein